MREVPSRLLVVTDRHLARRPLEDVIAQALDGGARWIWLRDRDLGEGERLALGGRLQRLCAQAGAFLSVGGDARAALTIGARGVHLAAGGDPAQARTILGEGALIGVSAHSGQEVASARAAGADYVTLSPIFETASKPGYGPPLGLPGLAAAAQHGLRVVALGGVGAATAPACIEAGASAVAVMGAVMRASSPAKTVAALMKAVDSASEGAA